MKNDYDPMHTVIWAVLFLLFGWLVCWLAGCVHVKLPDGTEYMRVGPQKIGEVLIEFPNGTQFLMVNQKAEMPGVKITATEITIGGKAVGQ